MISEADFQFCAKCGGKFNKLEENILVCADCKYKFYISPKPCNAVILVNEKNEIVLVKRKFAPKIGYWDLPGGFVDVDETLEESAIREIKEELGIDIKKVKYVRSYYDRYIYQNVNYYTLGVTFVAKMNDQKIKVADDASEFQWFSIKDLPWETIAFASVKKALEDYVESL